MRRAAPTLVGLGTLLAAACSSSPSAPLGGSDAELDAATSLPRDASTEAGRDARADAAPSDAATETDAAPDSDAAPAGPFACAADPSFPSTINLAEASAAAEVELTTGTRDLLVVTDSGNGGSALLVPLPTGTPRTITLPLDTAANDDLEGIAWRGGSLYTLTSSGAVRRFVPNGSGGLRREGNAYRLGAVPHACADLHEVNCGRNYEGLCLRAANTDAPCAGYAASRQDGKLYCLEIDSAGVLSASTTRAPIDTGIGLDKLSDCAFGTEGGAGQHALVVASNVYGLSRSYRIDEATGAKQQLPTPFLGNLEAVTIDREGALYTFSDDNSTGPSASNRMLCQNW